MTANKTHDDFLAQDAGADDSSFEATTSQPLSATDLEELLYGGDRPTAERLDLLMALRADIFERAEGDIAGSDGVQLLAAIDDRIAELRDADRQPTGGALDADPLAHRETLSPDSDELAALEAEDEASLGEDKSPEG